MRLLFGAASVKVAVGIVAAALVLTASSPPAPALPTWYYLALLVIFEVAAVWLFIGGRRDDRARALATLFVLFATLFTDRVAIRATARTPEAVDALLRLVAEVQLVAFCPFAFWEFVYIFPRPHPDASPRSLRSLMEVATLLTAVVLVVGHLIAVMPGVDPKGLGSWLAWTSQHDERLFWQVLTVLSIGCLSLLIVKWRRAALTDRRRLSWVVVGIVLGNLPMLAHILIATIVPAYAAFAAQPEVSRALGIILTMFTLMIPLTTAYAVVVEHALDVSFVVRRAVQYGLAKYTVVAAIIGLVMAVGLIAYDNRALPLSEVLARSPLTAGITLVLMALLFSRRALLSAIDRRFFRDHYDARQILLNLIEISQAAHSSRDVISLLVAEVGRALHLERVTLLMLDESGERLGDSQGRVQPLEFSGPLGTILSASRAPLDVDLSSSGSALARLPEPERDWLVDAGARLIVPLFGIRGTPIGVLVLGDKRSELPFTDEDKRLMTAVAASAALAIEQKISRESPDLDTPAVISRSNGAQCVSCGRVQPRPAQRCHACSGPLQDALLPLVLAGKFEIEQQIGAGGMGVVYRGRDLSLNRPVALKLLPRMGTAAATRLRREARAMAALQHSHLAVIHAMESWRGAPVLVLEYLAGGTLADRVRYGSMPVNDALSIFASLAEALRHIHDAGYLHRDIKPSNVGFSFHGVPKLLDFGLAQMVADASEAGSTITVTFGVITAPTRDGDKPHQTSMARSSSAQFVGTPAYMSPEAVTMQSPSPLIDLWSLALTMYEALTGKNPFRAPTVAESVKQILDGEVKDARILRPDCPPAIAQFLAAALSRNRHERPPTARDFLTRLQLAARP